MLCLSGFELYSRWVPLKDATCAVEERKPDKNEKFRLTGIQTLTSAIPVQCSNQYVLYCYLTVSNTSRILCILTSGATNVNIVQNHLNIALLNVF